MAAMGTCQHCLVSGPRRGQPCGKNVTSGQWCKKHATLYTVKINPTHTSSVMDVDHNPKYGINCSYIISKGERAGSYCGNPVVKGSIYCHACGSKKRALKCQLNGCTTDTPSNKMYCQVHSANEPNFAEVILPVQAGDSNNKRRTAIPQPVREQVWRKYLGNVMDGGCYCCDKGISFTGFHAGHVISDAQGGQATIENLRPVCSSCNLSMGTMLMSDYVQKYGLTGAAAQEWQANNTSNVKSTPAPVGPPAYQYGTALTGILPAPTKTGPSPPPRKVVTPPTSKAPDAPSKTSNTHISPDPKRLLLSAVGGAVRKMIPSPSANDDAVLDALLSDFDELLITPLSGKRK